MVAVWHRWPYLGQAGSPSTGIPSMNVARDAAEVLAEHTTRVAELAKSG